MLTRRQVLAATALAALFAAPGARAQDRLNVIASFSILGDFVKNVGGDRVEVATLVGPNGNAHVYAPSPGDAKKVADAKLVFVNGLGFEGWLEREVREVIAKIPADRRRVITSHSAFGYFQDAYGVSFTAPQGVSTEAEASAKDVAAIIAQIKKQKAAAVFLENVTDPRLVEQIARETGAKVGGTLYSDALTDDKGDATTYIDLIRHNLRQLASALVS